MRLAFLGAEGIPYPAAFAHYTEEVGKRLVKKGHQVWVYCRKHYVQNSSDYLGIKRIVLPSVNTKYSDTISHTFLSALHASFNRADIISIHGTGPSFWVLIPRLFRIKTVVHFHTLDWRRDKWGRFARLYLKMSEYCAVYLPDRTAAVSTLLQDYCLKKYGKRVAYIPPGINPAVYRAPLALKKFGLSKNDYVLFVGRLVPEKGCHYLIEAFEKVKTDKKLVVAGGADRSEEYVHLLRQTKDDRIVFVGHVQGELWEELFSNTYLFVQPSYVEGLPATVLQAMSYGCCVLVSDIPENLEAIGEFGYTFKQRDYLDLRDNLQFLLDNPHIVRRFSDQEKQYVYENYNWDKVAEKLEKLYLSLLTN